MLFAAIPRVIYTAKSINYALDFPGLHPVTSIRWLLLGACLPNSMEPLGRLAYTLWDAESVLALHPCPTRSESAYLPETSNTGILMPALKKKALGNVLPFEKAPEFTIQQIDNLDFMRSLPNESMQLIVTSPPYNLGKSYEKKKTSNEVYIEQQTAAIAEAYRLLSPRGSICWQVGNYVEDGEIYPLDIILYQKFKDLGMQLRNRIIWTYGHGLHCQNRFSGRHETILWFTKTNDYVFNLDPVRVPSKYPEKKYFKGPKRGQYSSNPLGKNPSDVWDIPNVKANHVEKLDHPCQFPIGLVERLVLSLTNKGDNVLDPYLGVGSSAIAALKNNRNVYGCDTQQEYIKIALERVEQLQLGTLRTRPMNKPVYEPPLLSEDE
jgi:adenine-specific DNA-methyltransferase